MNVNDEAYISCPMTNHASISRTLVCTRKRSRDDVTDEVTRGRERERMAEHHPSLSMTVCSRLFAVLFALSNNRVCQRRNIMRSRRVLARDSRWLLTHYADSCLSEQSTASANVVASLCGHCKHVSERSTHFLYYSTIHKHSRRMFVWTGFVSSITATRIIEYDKNIYQVNHSPSAAAASV